MEKVPTIAQLLSRRRIPLPDGAYTLSNFYHNVLPQLQEVADITEENPEKFRQYLTPEAHFVFYLDMENDNVICKVSAFYGKREFSVGKLLLHEDISPDQQFRDFPLENSVLDQTMEWRLTMIPTLTYFTATMTKNLATDRGVWNCRPHGAWRSTLHQPFPQQTHLKDCKGFRWCVRIRRTPGSEYFHG